MKKIDIIQEGMKIPKIEYEVYSKLSGKKLKKLILSICENSKIILSVPVSISENLDKLNSSSGYFNDICYTKTSDDGTDISLKDRKKEFVEGNKSVCQDDCDFSEYDDNTQRAKCSCKVKELSSSFIDMNINKSKLYEQFFDVKNIANINLLGCYENLFSLTGLLKNIGNYIMIIIILLHIIFMFIFYIKQLNSIKNVIKELIFALEYFTSAKKNQKLVIKRKRVK